MEPDCTLSCGASHQAERPRGVAAGLM